MTHIAVSKTTRALLKAQASAYALSLAGYLQVIAETGQPPPAKDKLKHYETAFSQIVNFVMGPDYVWDKGLRAKTRKALTDLFGKDDPQKAEAKAQFMERQIASTLELLKQV